MKTPRGERPIEELEVGDEIIVADPTTGLTAVSRLEAVIKSTVASDHPLHDPHARGFFPAGDWLLGLRTHLFEITDSGATVRWRSLPGYMSNEA